MIGEKSKQTFVDPRAIGGWKEKFTPQEFTLPDPGKLKPARSRGGWR